MKYKGRLKGFPDEVVQKMLYYQVQQGNKEDISVFEESNTLSHAGGGFDWDRTSEGISFWDEVISGNFNLFFQEYPKKSNSISQNNNNMEIIGYKLNDQLIEENEWDRSYLLRAIANIGYIHDYTRESHEVLLNSESKILSTISKNEAVLQHLKNAGVLNYWLEPVYKKKYELPIIAGYKGEDLGDRVKYGCKSVSVSAIRELVQIGIREMYVYGNDKSDIIPVSGEKLKAILEYFDNK